jgi:hypothetical protein
MHNSTTHNPGACRQASTAQPFLLLSFAIQLAGKAVQQTPQILLHATVPSAASFFVPYSMWHMPTWLVPWVLACHDLLVHG